MSNKGLPGWHIEMPKPINDFSTVCVGRQIIENYDLRPHGDVLAVDLDRFDPTYHSRTARASCLKTVNRIVLRGSGANALR